MFHHEIQREKASRNFAPALFQYAALLTAAGIALVLGFSNLEMPSLWHDELVHVYVAKNIVEHGQPALPSGHLYPSALAHTLLLSVFIAVGGMGEFVVRTPSVLLGGLNILLLFLLARKLLGTSCALLSAFLLALSPWHVAWSREARMYELQMTCYLLALIFAWTALSAESRKRGAWFAAAACTAYFLGVFTSFHSILFLAAIGGFSILMLLGERKLRSRWTVAMLVCVVVGGLTLLGLLVNPNPVDQSAVFETGLGGTLVDPQRIDRFLYFRWLSENLSLGYFLLAMLGTGLAIYREKRNGLFAVLAFWAPVLVLTFLIGYRRDRFMYFAYPCYVMLTSYALLRGVSFALTWRKSMGHAMLALLILLFGVRLALSTVALTKNSIEIAQGADITLAKHHPQWRAACAYVKARVEGEAVLSTTYLPALYYVGRVDNWFPNRYSPWEYQDSGVSGLGSLEELKDFLRQHPKGYFLAEFTRFEKWRHHGALKEDLGREVDWVQDNMQRVEADSSADVTVYRWDFTANPGGL